MARRRRLQDGRIPERWRDPKTWPPLDEKAFRGDKLKVLRRRDAVIEYMTTDLSLAELERRHGVKARRINTDVERCTTELPSGEIVGFPALQCYKRLKEYTRRSGPNLNKELYGGRFWRRTFSGCYLQLRREHPSLEDFLRARLKGLAPEVRKEKRVPFKSIHQMWLDELKRIGVPETAYPFCAPTQGKEPLRLHLHRLMAEEMMEMARDRFAPEGEQLYDSARVVTPPIPELPFEVAQIDETDTDMMFVMTVDDQNGVPIEIEVERLCLIGVIEQASHAWLGYETAINQRYTGDLVAQAVRNSLMPWQPRQLGIPGLTYPPGAGMPSSSIPECTWALLYRYELDNLRSHHSKGLVTFLAEDLLSVINHGKPHVGFGRETIERAFRTLKQAVFHRTPVTTGSRPDDPARDDPEGAARKLPVRYSDLLDIIDITIATYNSTPQEGLGGLSPLEYLRSAIRAGVAKPFQVPQWARPLIAVATRRFECTVRGSIKKGRRPHVQVLGALYSNAKLSNRADLIGSTIFLDIEIDDGRKGEAFSAAGEPLGTLIAQGMWGAVEHTLGARQLLQRQGKRATLTGSDLNALAPMIRRGLMGRREFMSIGPKRIAKALQGASGSRAYASVDDVHAVVRRLLPALQLASPARTLIGRT
jgi:putative transposase